MVSGLGSGTLSKTGRFTSFALTPSSWKLLFVGRCPLTLIVTCPRPSAAESNSSVLAPAERVSSVKKFRVESGSAGGLRANRLAGRCRSDIHGRHDIFHRNGFSYLPDNQSRIHARCFRYLNKDVGHNKFGKSCGRDFKAVTARWKTRNIKRSRASAYHFSFLLAGG